MRLRRPQDVNDLPPSTAGSPAPLPKPPPSAMSTAVRICLAVAFGVLALVDLVMSLDTSGPLLPTAGLVPAALVLSAPYGSRHVRTAAASLWSLLCTGFLVVRGGEPDTPGLVELLALSVLLATSVRRFRAGPRAFLSCAAPLLALVLLGARVARSASGIVLSMLLLLLVAACVIALGVYVRAADTRRAYDREQVRQEELQELANDLHDFVAHHVTGIIVLAQAGQAICESGQRDVVPVLNDIERAGIESLDSIRQLISFRREESGQLASSLLPAQSLAHIPALVDSFRRGGHEVLLELAEPALSTQLAPEIVTTTHRLITEGLSNVRLHTPDATDLAVSVVLGPEGLRATVRNGPPAGGRPPRTRHMPQSRQRGNGLLRLRERVRAVGGTLTHRADAAGGWELTALLPVRDAHPEAWRPQP